MGSIVSGLTGSTVYDCFVKLTNACGSSCSSAGSQTTLTSCTPPAAPTSVTATAVATSTGHMNVQWTHVASTTWTVKCVDNSGSSATCAGTSVGTVQAFTCTSSPCSTTVTGLTDNTPYICCVDSALTATPTCKSSPASSASVTTCTTPVAPTVSSVTATASDTLTVSWGSVSNAVSYSYFCATGSSQPNTAPSVGTRNPTPPVASSPGRVSNLPASTYTCFAQSTNACGSTYSSGVGGVICAITPPSTVSVTGATATSLDLSWSAVTGVATYKAFCVLRNPQGTGAATQTCSDTALGVVTVGAPAVTATVTATITGLTANTQYACFVKSIDNNSCESACSTGTEYLTSQTGTSSMLTQPTLTTLVFDDGADPAAPNLPSDKAPVYPVDESTCTNSNEFPDEKDPSAAARALQIILNVEGYTKPTFEGSFDIQAKFYKALSGLSSAIGTGDVCMRIFNVDNSRHGAGVKTRIWFNTQADCIDFAEYVRSLWGPSGSGTLQNSMGSPNTFRDINNANYQPFDTATFGLSGYTGYTGPGGGGVTIRMITNPRSKCHKWKFPTASVCSAQLTYYTPGATTKPTSPTGRNTDTNACENEEDPIVPTNTNSNTVFQVVFSMSARRKISGTGTLGYDNDNTFAQHVILAFKSYFTTANWSPSLMQIKNVDNSAAGVGLHVRLYIGPSEKSDCNAMASSMYANERDLTDAEAALRETWLYDNVFQPYEAALGAAYAGYFGTITRRASMASCINYAGRNANIPVATGDSIAPGQKDWVGDPMLVSIEIG